MEKIKVGNAYTLNNILFASKSFELNDTSRIVLNSFAEFLEQNAKVKAAIHGHTDDVGNDQDNLVLSDNRAKSVYEYLQKQGIKASRLSYKGFGELKPVADNNTETGRAKNRRTEFVIVEK